MGVREERGRKQGREKSGEEGGRERGKREGRAESIGLQVNPGRQDRMFTAIDSQWPQTANSPEGHL